MKMLCSLLISGLFFSCSVQSNLTQLIKKKGKLENGDKILLTQKSGSNKVHVTLLNMGKRQISTISSPFMYRDVLYLKSDSVDIAMVKLFDKKLDSIRSSKERYMCTDCDTYLWLEYTKAEQSSTPVLDTLYYGKCK